MDHPWFRPDTIQEVVEDRIERVEEPGESRGGERS